ncbi:hypothetical protein Taro_054420 [Colocasia esculenta]|uniref:Uncharacterized protein n=1 Tax=Colocasia esculenta TaxID=4460 RepID=A0A843XQI3_COLES|nr:hypothetical protein [Colocasia esculenta]
MDNNGMSPSSEDMAWALLQITLRLTYQWERTDKIDREMLVHMSTMHRSWRSKQKKRSNMHGRNLHRLELLKMGRCKYLPDDSETCVDEESKRRYETMTQMIPPSSDVDAESHTPTTPEDAFILVMGKDRPGHVRCAGSGETLSPWYKSIGTSASSERERIMQEQLKAQEEKLKAHAEEMTQMREKISRLKNIATKVDEISTLLSQIQASQTLTQHVPTAVQSESDSETDVMADDYSDHVS